MPWVTLRAMLALALVSSTAACDAFPNICARPESELPRRYTGGFVEDGVYRSAEWDGELLHYPAGAYYEIQHGLGEVPGWVEVYLSFERFGTDEGAVAPAAGNLAEIGPMTDDDLIVTNATCSEFYALVIAGVGDRE